MSNKEDLLMKLDIALTDLDNKYKQNALEYTCHVAYLLINKDKILREFPTYANGLIKAEVWKGLFSNEDAYNTIADNYELFINGELKV